MLIGLIAWMFNGTPVLDQFGPLLVGLFPMIVMFLVTSVATLRERTSGHARAADDAADRPR